MTDQTKTAFEVANSMNLPDYASQALDYNRHPQIRTRAFHQMFDAPIRDAQVDETFSHMDDQRVAFRVSFIVSEIFELMEKGLGLQPAFAIMTGTGPVFVHGSDNAELTNAILEAMASIPAKRDIIEVVDALGDLNVVTNGFAIELGVDMLDIDAEVLASNFTKADENGQPIVADGSDPKYPAGKILKGPNFVEPNIRAVLGLPAPQQA